MSKILCIDTATDICSVVLAENSEILASKESGNERSHAVQLAVFIDEVLKMANLQVGMLDAISISRGPGSYTGLRIGVSTAKGLCYGGNKPLLSVSTLQSMCYGIPESFLKENNLKDFFFAPMLDARRMEVYTALYNPDYTAASEVEALIIDEKSFHDVLEQKPVVFFGNGAFKTRDLLTHPNALFYEHYKHSAIGMVRLSEEKFKQEKFEDAAYFEPYYLKEFISTVSKKNLLMGEGL